VKRSDAKRCLRALHEAQQVFYAGGPGDALRELLTEDVRWHVPGGNAIAGRYRGIEEVMDYFARRRDLASRTFRMFPGELLVGEGPYVASLTEGRATIGDEEHRWSTVGLYRFRGSRVAAVWLLPLDQDEFDRIWAERP
jgi:ketosteroid isomerase-like protein